MKAPREQDLVKPALQLLALRGCFCWRNNTGAVSAGEGSRRRFIRFSTPGASDILGVLPGGRFICVELKRKGNKPTALQRSFLEAVRSAGGAALVVSSLAELDRRLGEGLAQKPARRKRTSP
jgi:hypothetical protein